MTISDTGLISIAIGSAAVALLSLAMTLALGRRLRRIRRLVRPRPRAREAASPGDGSSDWDALGVAYEVAELRDGLARSIQRVGMVRFDAFEDMGGELSFATAMLDADGSGIVLSAINGRSETRIYAKPVDRGSCSYNLSDEEQEAIARAMKVPGS